MQHSLERRSYGAVNTAPRGAYTLPSQGGSNETGCDPYKTVFLLGCIDSIIDTSCGIECSDRWSNLLVNQVGHRWGLPPVSSVTSNATTVMFVFRLRGCIHSFMRLLPITQPGCLEHKHVCAVRSNKAYEQQCGCKHTMIEVSRGVINPPEVGMMPLATHVQDVAHQSRSNAPSSLYSVCAHTSHRHKHSTMEGDYLPSRACARCASILTSMAHHQFHVLHAPPSRLS